MVRYLTDPANAITATGLLFSAIGLHLTVAGRPDLGVAAVLWAMLADHLDGVVAARTRNRAPETARIGKSLDGFADLVYGAVFPAVVLIQVSDASLLALFTAGALLLAGALRLSYFSSFGLSSDGRFTGVPLSYDVPLLAILFLLAPAIPPASFPLLVNLGLLTLAVLHILTIRVPRTSGAMYVVITLFSVGASGTLVLRGLA